VQFRAPQQALALNKIVKPVNLPVSQIIAKILDLPA